MNQINLLGRIVRDPILKTTSSGKPFCAFTLAVDNFYNGDKKTQFIPCFVWGQTAENTSKYCKKGKQIMLEGFLTVRQENNNDQYSTIMTVNANKIHFLSGPNLSEKITEQDYLTTNIWSNHQDEDGYKLNDKISAKTYEKIWGHPPVSENENIIWTDDIKTKKVETDDDSLLWEEI